MDDYLKLTFIVDPFEPWADVLSYQLAEIGFESFEKNEPELKAYIQEGEYDEEKIYEIVYELSESARLDFNQQRIEKQNWNQLWEENYPPVKLEDKLLIRATFHPSEPGFEHELILQPKMSFGTGHHATTKLMAKAMFDCDFAGKRVLDVGTGTGILAILAFKMGAKEVLGIDIDHWSVENARENADTNDCSEVQIEKGEIADVDLKSYNVILANINLNVILNDLKTYVNHLETNGELLLSGFLNDDADNIRNACKEQGLREVNAENEGEWCMMHFLKEA